MILNLHCPYCHRTLTLVPDNFTTVSLQWRSWSLSQKETFKCTYCTASIVIRITVAQTSRPTDLEQEQAALFLAQKEQPK